MTSWRRDTSSRAYDHRYLLPLLAGARATVHLPRYRRRGGAGTSLQGSGFPATIGLDQGSEFVSRDLDLWAYQRGVTLDFSGRDKPTDNAFIEAFNFRAERLNAHWFLSLADAQQKVETRRRYYNEERPHAVIGNRPPILLQNHVGATSPPT